MKTQNNEKLNGVYHRMYRAMEDHKKRLISFPEMLKIWKEEAEFVKIALEGKNKSREAV